MKISSKFLLYYLFLNRILFKEIKSVYIHSISRSFTQPKYATVTYGKRLIFKSPIIIKIWMGFYLSLLRKRIYHRGELKSIYNDPDLMLQWYFIQKYPWSNHISHNLNKVWERNITGKGIVIAIVGGRIEDDHRDINNNYYKQLNYDFISYDHIPHKSISEIDTQAAGLVSAEANNNVCGVGAAPSSKFINLRIIDQQKYLQDYEKLEKSLAYENQVIDIYLVNVGIHSGKELKRISAQFAQITLKNGRKYGRNEYGVLYITSSGSNRMNGSNCALNSFIQSPYVYTFGSISLSGYPVLYSERCLAILASALSSSDMQDNNYLYTTTVNNKCNISAYGSFVSSAISAGIIALLLSYDPTLTSRQVMVSIIHSSIQYDLTAIRNAAGYLYSYSMGFGMIDAEKLIFASQHPLVKKLRRENACLVESTFESHIVVKNKLSSFFIYSSGCSSNPYCVSEIEQIMVNFHVSSYRRNAIFMYLISPSRTTFTILEPRYYDNSRNGYHNWRLKLMGFFGEKAQGVWNLKILCREISCRIAAFSLRFYGTCNKPKTTQNSHNIIKEFIICSPETNISSLHERVSFHEQKRDLKYSGVDSNSFILNNHIMMEKIRDLS